MHGMLRLGAAVLVVVTGVFIGPVSALEEASSSSQAVESQVNAADTSANSTPEVEGVICPEDSVEDIEKTSTSKDEEIQRLQKLKEYYETNIRRLSRTAWRLEFKDPGYSRILDERVAQLQRKLDAVNKQLAEKGVKSS